MFGYSSGQPTTKSHFGSVPSTFAMDDVSCFGNETSLLDCPHVTVDNCGSHEAAGVICSNSGPMEANWLRCLRFWWRTLHDQLLMCENGKFCSHYKENLVRYCMKSVLSQIRHHLSLFGSGNGTGTTLDWDFCTSSAPCTQGHGDCDGDDECVEHHVCGEDNCRHFWTQAEALADCCVPGVVGLFWIFRQYLVLTW